MRYAAGLDGGGTKTTVRLIREDGSAEEATFGSLNITGAPESVLMQTLKDVVTYLARTGGSLSACAGITVATAGISNPDCKRIIETGLRRAGYQGAFDLRGDQEAALTGAVGAVGAVLIAGTGSICFGHNTNGDTLRTGGRGHLIDDEGSGYAIGRDILKAVVRAEDGRIPPTCLTAAVKSALEIDTMGELIRFVYAPTRIKQDTAQLAPLLLPALAAADAAALTIADHAADELALLCIPVIERLHLTKERLAMTGSILHHYDSIADGVKSRLLGRFPDLQVVKPIGSAACGAGMLAKEKYLG